MDINMRVSKSKKTKLSNKKIFLFILGLFVVGGLAFYYFKHQEKQLAPSANPTSLGEKINFNPPTEEDKQDVVQHKQELVNQQQVQNNTKPTGNVTPIITDAGFYDGQVEVRSFISGIYESGGTCTVILTKGSAQVTKEGKSSKGATTTDCPPVIIPKSELNPGIWNVHVSYSSGAAQGNSETKTVEVK